MSQNMLTQALHGTKARKLDRGCPKLPDFLDLGEIQQETKFMAHIYLLFDFAQDEEKAQQARHKLEGWKQAFRLDKKLLYKVERSGGDAAEADGDAKAAKAAKDATTEKRKGKGKAAAKAEATPETAAAKEDIKLFVRLAFSGHEKLSEQRWVDRIPAEEPFQGASPKVVKSGDEAFAATEKQFEELS
jgi:hypothetical protein